MDSTTSVRYMNYINKVRSAFRLKVDECQVDRRYPRGAQINTVSAILIVLVISRIINGRDVSCYVCKCFPTSYYNI